MTSGREFGYELREALNHLDDPGFLKGSTLVDRLCLSDVVSPAESLRAALLQAIDAFRPADGTTGQERLGRHFRILRGRYVERLTQPVLAERLAVSVRHLRREQRAALDALGDYIRLRFEFPLETGGTEEGTAGLRAVANSALINQEMAWLSESQGSQQCSVVGVLEDVTSLGHSLSDAYGVSVTVRCPKTCPLVEVPRVVLRQALLNALTALVPRCTPKEAITLVAHTGTSEVTILLKTENAPGWRSDNQLEDALEMSDRLLKLFGGGLDLHEVDLMPIVRFRLPQARAHRTVLAVEDNADTISLWRQYVKGTLFTLVSESEPRRVIDRAVQVLPDIIILDVMLPGMDGWELLQMLRQEAAIETVPIVVCTVLPQKDLALSLGADGFIQKPTTGREFRAMLERQTSAVEPRLAPQHS